MNAPSFGDLLERIASVSQEFLPKCSTVTTHCNVHSQESNVLETRRRFVWQKYLLHRPKALHPVRPRQDQPPRPHPDEAPRSPSHALLRLRPHRRRSFSLLLLTQRSSRSSSAASSPRDSARLSAIMTCNAANTSVRRPRARNWPFSCPIRCSPAPER